MERKRKTKNWHSGFFQATWQQTIKNIPRCLKWQSHLKVEWSADECIPRYKAMIDISYNSILNPIKIPYVFLLSVCEQWEKENMSSEMVDSGTGKRCCAAQITFSNCLIMEESTCFVEEQMRNGALSKHSARCHTFFPVFPLSPHTRTICYKLKQ